MDRKITYSQLPEPERFSNAINDRKHFADTIKMIAYRGETAMCNLIRKDMGHPNEARKLMRRIYMSDADIQPNYDNKTLTVSLHRLNHWRDDKVMGKLCEQMNQTQTRFPGTDLTIKYKVVAADNP